MTKEKAFDILRSARFIAAGTPVNFEGMTQRVVDPTTDEDIAGRVLLMDDDHYQEMMDLLADVLEQPVPETTFVRVESGKEFRWE